MEIHRPCILSPFSLFNSIRFTCSGVSSRLPGGRGGGVSLLPLEFPSSMVAVSAVVAMKEDVVMKFSSLACGVHFRMKT